MGAEIKDEYTELSISRQRKYYLRQRRRKRCTKCGRPVEEGSLCLEHLIQMREYRREKFGLKRRYLNASSYQVTGKADVPPVNGNSHPQPDPLPIVSPPVSRTSDINLPLDDNLRTIKRRVDSVLASLTPELEHLPSNHSPFPPELLLKSWVLSNLYSIRSTRLFCEQLPYNLLWLWFLDLELGKVQFEPEAFEQAYDRLLHTEVARNFLGSVFSANTLAVA
jgi:transposase